MNPSDIRQYLAAAVVAMLVFPQAGIAQTNPPVPPDRDLPMPYRVEIVASRLQAPWSVVFTPDGRMFFSERPGRVRVMEQGKLLDEPALMLQDVVLGVKMGLLGMAVHPGFATNHWFYLAYNYTNAAGAFRLRVVRYEEKNNQLIQPLTLIEDIPAFLNHTGCRLRFGPDGRLYLTTGDANNPPAAQSLGELSGKILRLNPDGSIPQDNPFVGRPGARPEIWSYGHRNPQGLDFQPGTGDLFAAEHGPDNGDEVNLINKGENYGWPVIHHRQTNATMHSPLLEFTPSIGPSGLLIYRGDAFPQLKGNVLVGCLRGEGILRVQLDGTHVLSCERWLHHQFGRIRDVVEGPDGCIYFTTSQFDPPEGTPRPEYDMILRLVPTNAPATGLRLATPWGGPVIDPMAFDPATTNARVLVGGYCAPCHGPGLAGGMQRGLIYTKWQYAKNDDDIRRIIRQGMGEKGMPAFGNTLKAPQIDALLGYIREHESPTNVPPPLIPPTVNRPAKPGEFE